MKKKIVISFDMEHDYQNTNKFSFHGCDFIFPFLEKLSIEKGILFTIFCTSSTLLKYTNKIRKLLENGNDIGVHNSFHDILCNYNYTQQFEQIYLSTSVHRIVLDENPKLFRAPNFSVDKNTIKILDELNYQIDSSVLPGRKYLAIPKIKERIIQLYLSNINYGIIPHHYDFSSFPLDPYHPSYDNIGVPGQSKILEFPVSKNLQGNAIPISGGSLREWGIDNEIKSIHEAENETIILVYHPWEFLILKNKKYIPNERLFKEFLTLLNYCQKNFDICTLSRVV